MHSMKIIYIIITDISNAQTNKIILANKKLDNNLREGQNFFRRYINLEVLRETSTDSRFNKEIEIKIKRFDNNRDGLVDETNNIYAYNLKPYYLNENTSTWETMENFVYNSNDGTIKFYTSHFSLFGIFGGIEEKNLDIKNIIFYPNPFKIKEHRRCVFSNFSEDINFLSL